MTESTADRSQTRRQSLQKIAMAVGAITLVWGAWYVIFERHHVSTDNAYVAGNVLQITPQVGGTVIAIQADETDFVQAGQVLIKLDPADTRVALDQAKSQLAQTVRDVRGVYANAAGLSAQVQLREADADRANVELARVQEDVNRRAPLVSTGAVSKEEFQHITAQLDAAKKSHQAAMSALTAAREQYKAARSQTEGVEIANHPNVQRAAAHLREAFLAFQRSNVLAPAAGHVAKRQVQVGQRVQAGAPLMTMVAFNQLWVDANFKESQLQDLRIGQPAEITADVYGKKVTYHGRVLGLGAGTGAAFSLIPAQNATGNWIKVVQRVPVRIGLDASEMTQHPLRVGLSMEVNVDTADQSGKVLSDTQRQEPASATTIYDSLQQAADLEVRQVIQANLGQDGAAP